MFNQCPICTSQSVEEYIFTSSSVNRKLGIILCKVCGHAININWREEQDNLRLQKAFFDGNPVVPKKRYTLWPRRPALLVNEVLRLAKRKGKALDVGCNTGMWFGALGSGWEKYGVELSSVAAAIAQKYTDAEIYCGPFESYRAEPGSFNLVTAFAVIEHLSNPRIFVKWAYDHLKRDGLFVLMTGDRESETALRMGPEWPLYTPESHVSFFSARSLSHLVEREGFRIERKEWRFMYTAQGMGSKYFRAYMKIKEIFRCIEKPVHDHFYLYARKI